MLQKPSGYVFDSAIECDRLERQATIIGMERLLRHFPPQPQARILDAGCGSGAMARLLAARHPDAEVVGIDFNPGYLAYARQKAAAEGLGNLTFESGDLQALALADAGFDRIWSQFVLNFVPSPEAALREFHRLLKPGGAVIIVLIEMPGMIGYPEDPLLQGRLERVVMGFGDFKLARKLPVMLRTAGFADITVEIEIDPIYTVMGPIAPDQQRNLVELFTAAMPRIAKTLGGQAEAEAYVADRLAYNANPDTCSYSKIH